MAGGQGQGSTRETETNLILCFQIGKMASAEALQKLETRAVAAEKLISLLKLQIAEAKVYS